MSKKKPIKKTEKKPSTMGAPSKYRPDYPEKMIEYFTRARDIIKKTQFARHGEKEYIEFPTFQGFAGFECGVGYQTLLNWCKEHPDFLDAYEHCKAVQEQIIVKGGITRLYDPTFAKFILGAVSNTFKEKQHIEHELGDNAKNVVKLAYNIPEEDEDE